MAGDDGGEHVRHGRPRVHARVYAVALLVDPHTHPRTAPPAARALSPHAPVVSTRMFSHAHGLPCFSPRAAKLLPSLAGPCRARVECELELEQPHVHTSRSCSTCTSAPTLHSRRPAAALHRGSSPPSFCRTPCQRQAQARPRDPASPSLCTHTFRHPAPSQVSRTSAGAPLRRRSPSCSPTSSPSSSVIHEEEGLAFDSVQVHARPCFAPKSSSIALFSALLLHLGGRGFES